MRSATGPPRKSATRPTRKSASGPNLKKHLKMLTNNIKGICKNVGKSKVN